MGLGDLGDMKQGIDARLKLDKGAKIRHAGDTAADDVTNSVFLLSLEPRVLVGELEGEGDLLTLDLLDEGLDLIANLEDLLGALDAAPGHLGDVKQTVSSAQIDESAEIGKVLDLALDDHAFLDAGHKGFLHLGLAGNQELLAVADDAAAARVILDDHELNLLILILGEVSLKAVGHKACRDKDANAIN